MDHPQFYSTAVRALKDTDVHTVVICNVKSYLPGVKGLHRRIARKDPQGR